MTGSEKSIKIPTYISLKTGETIIMTPEEDNFNPKSQDWTIKDLLHFYFYFEDDQNQEVSLTTTEELLNDGIGILAKEDTLNRCHVNYGSIDKGCELFVSVKNDFVLRCDE